MSIPKIDDGTIEANKKHFLDNGFEQLTQEAFIYRNFLTPEECDEIVEEVRASNSYKNGNTFVYVNSIKKYRERIKQLLNIEDNSLISDDIDHVIIRHRMHRDFPHNDVLRHVEDLIANWSWEATKHHNRKMPLHYCAFIMYFNDDFDGGELVYPEYKLMYKPKKGDIVFHNIDTIHAVNEVLSDSDRISFQGSIAHYRWINSDFLESVYSKINNNEYEGGSNDFFIHQLPIHNKRLKKFAEENSHLVKDWHPKSNKIFRLEY